MQAPHYTTTFQVGEAVVWVSSHCKTRVTQRVLGVHKTRLVGDGFVHTPHFSPSRGVTVSHTASFQTRQEYLATDKMPYIQNGMPEVHAES